MMNVKLSDYELDILNTALREYINNRVCDLSSLSLIAPEAREFLWDVIQLKGHLKALKRYK